MKLNFTLFSLLYTLLTLNAASQNTPNIIPPSPEVAALAKYGDVPVSLYTGTPQIEIPVYNLQCGSLHVPISLSYYASGVKVEDVSTWVGMGWVLNAGGVITRTIRGKAENVLSNGKIYPTVSELPIPQTNITTNDFSKVVNLATNASESEPDVFYYNFNGRSGSFYFDTNGKPVIKKQENIKIEYLFVSTYASRFILTLEDGAKYYFEDITKNGETGDVSAWYLTKITDVNDKHYINFSYVEEQYRSPSVPRFSKYYYFTSTTSPGLALPKFTDPICQDNFANNKRLTSISSSTNNTILFTPKSELRKDVFTTNAKALEVIEVKNPDNKTIKKLKLTTNNIVTLKRYVTPTFGTSCPGVTDDAPLNYRLYLEEITDCTNPTEPLPPYKLYYYGRSSANQDSLAHRLSAAQDWAGYYNGQDDNVDLIPEFNNTLNPTIAYSENGVLCAELDKYPNSPVYFPGSNRRMNVTCKKMGTPKSITFPTGGITQFYFSSFNMPPYEGAYEGSLRIDKIENFDADGKKIKSKRYEYEGILPGYLPRLY